MRWNTLSAILPVAVVLCLLLFWLPANLLPRLLLGENPPLTSVSGTFWHGQGRLLHRQDDLGLLSWDVDWQSLLEGIPWVDVQLIKSEEQVPDWILYSIHARVQVDGLNVRIADLTGEVEPTWLAGYLPHIGSSLEITNKVSFRATGHWQRQSLGQTFLWHIPASAEGSVDWPGGQVALVLGSVRLIQDFPPVVGRLFQAAEQLEFELTTAEDSAVLADLALNRKGILQLRSHYQLLEKMKLPVRRPSPQEEIFNTLFFDLSDVLPTI